MAVADFTATELDLDRLADLVAERVADLVAERGAPLLDADQAAALLNVPPSWILAEARAERVPVVRLGRYVRFRRHDLIAWTDGHTVGPRPRSGAGS